MLGPCSKTAANTFLPFLQQLKLLSLLLLTSAQKVEYKFNVQYIYYLINVEQQKLTKSQHLNSGATFATRHLRHLKNFCLKVEFYGRQIEYDYRVKKATAKVNLSIPDHFLEPA